MTLRRREEIIRKRLEAERREKIERVLQRKIEGLHKELGVHVEELRREFDLAE